MDRQIYGSTSLSWNECVDLLGYSLAQLHINDGKGTNNRPIGGTIELREGHLYNGELQRRTAEWLLANVGDVFY